MSSLCLWGAGVQPVGLCWEQSHREGQPHPLLSRALSSILSPDEMGLGWCVGRQELAPLPELPALYHQHSSGWGLSLRTDGMGHGQWHFSNCRSSGTPLGAWWKCRFPGMDCRNPGQVLIQTTAVQDCLLVANLPELSLYFLVFHFLMRHPLQGMNPSLLPQGHCHLMSPSEARHMSP